MEKRCIECGEVIRGSSTQLELTADDVYGVTYMLEEDVLQHVCDRCLEHLPHCAEIVEEGTGQKIRLEFGRRVLVWEAEERPPADLEQLREFAKQRLGIEQEKPEEERSVPGWPEIKVSNWPSEAETEEGKGLYCTIVKFELREAITPDVLTSIERLFPKLPAHKGVVISGRGPIWLFCALAHHYHYALWVATHDPRLEGVVVVMSHSPEVRVGQVLKIENIFFL